MTAVAQVLRFQGRCVALQLLLLLLFPLQLFLHAFPCSTTVEEMVVATTSDAEELAEALECDGSGSFAVSWQGDVMPSRTFSVSNGSMLNMTGSSESMDDADKGGAFIKSNGTVLLFEIDSGSIVSLTGLTLTGGDGALRVTEESFVEVTDCNFTHNKRTSSDLGGAIFVNGSTVVLKGETVFTNNTANYGGAIYSVGSSEFNVTQGASVSFFSNHAGIFGGAIRFKGQSVFNSFGTASFVSNEAVSGGAAHFDGSGLNFIIGNGALENNHADISGGAVCVDHGSIVFLGSKTVFSYNTAKYGGGAIYLDYSSKLNITERGSVSFFNNHAGSPGGALSLNDQSVFTSYGTAVFVSNEATFGGAIKFDDSEGNFIGNVSFEENHAATNGGAVDISDGSTALVAGKTVYAYNTAPFGGALYIYNRSVFSSYGTASFTSNEAILGGAVHVNVRSLAFFADEAVFSSNTAAFLGGAIYSADSSKLNVTKEGSVFFFKNHAGIVGGAIRLVDQSVFSSDGTASFVSNEATFGGAIQFDDSEGNFIGNVSFQDNHAATNGGAVDISYGSTALFAGETVFAYNTAPFGGASYINNRSVFNSYGTASFIYNEAILGGAIYLVDGETNFIGNVWFKGNHANSSGGAVYTTVRSIAFFVDEAVFSSNTAAIFGGAISTIGGSELNVKDEGSVFFFNNQAGIIGGAVYLYSQSAFSCYGSASFVSNDGGYYGGAMHFDGSKGIFIGNVSMKGNHAVSNGGAVEITCGSNVFFRGEAFFANNTAIFGGAFLCDNSEVNFIGNISFEGNHAIFGGGAADISNVSNASFGGDIFFAWNTAPLGGAIYAAESSEVSLTEGGSAYFLNNYADTIGGAIRLYQSVFNSYSTASFVSNEAEWGGGAIHCQSSELHFIGNVSFEGNHAVFNGGAVDMTDRSDAVFKGQVVFAYNTAQNGGASFIFNRSVLNHYGTALFASNKAEFGGALFCDDGETNFIGNVSFEGNQANINGGAIASEDAGIINIDGLASFVGNKATDNGGAIYATDSSVFVETGTRFMLNVASTGSGGGVHASSSVIALTGVVFNKNIGAWGGGLAFFSSGSLLEIGDSSPTKVTGCSFDGNTATDGGAIYTAAGYDMVVGSSFTRNFAAVQGGALLHSSVLVALAGCSFESNTAGEDGLAVMSLGMVNNITDVMFRNNSFFCSSGKYGLKEDSNEIEDSDTCRWGVVCSRCTDQCNAPAGIDMDETTVPICEVVPEGVNTTGNYGMTLDTLDLLSGFYRTSNESREVMECYRKEACVGGSHAGRYCADGYAGPYCATCKEGYGSGFQYSCHSCQGPDKRAAIGGAIAVLVVVIFVVALVVAYLVGVVDQPISERNGKWERRASKFRDGLVRAIPLTAIKIVLVSWQIVTQFSGVVNVQFPPLYEKFLAALSVVNLNLGFILSLSCVVETNFYARLILVTIAPVTMLGILVITYRVAVMRNGHSIHAMRGARNKHLSVGLFLLFVVYSSVSYTIFQTFVCDSLDNEVTYLRADYDLVCFTSTHVGFMAYAGVMVFVYPVGIPAVFAWVLFINRNDIKSVAGATNTSSVPPEAEAIKDLWAPYKRSRYYYEVIECGRRIALTGLAVFIYPGSTAQVAIEALLAVVFSSIFEVLSPFAEPLDAWLYRCGTWVIFLSMYLALLLKMDGADEESHSQDIFAGLLIAAHVAIVLVVIANALLSALKGFREVQAIEMPVVMQDPSTRSGSTSTKYTGIEIPDESKDDARL